MSLNFIEAQILLMEERLNKIKKDLDANIIDLNIVQTVIIDYAYGESINWDEDLIKHREINIIETFNVKEIEI